MWMILCSSMSAGRLSDTDSKKATGSINAATLTRSSPPPVSATVSLNSCAFVRIPPTTKQRPVQSRRLANMLPRRAAWMTWNWSYHC